MTKHLLTLMSLHSENYLPRKTNFTIPSQPYSLKNQPNSVILRYAQDLAARQDGPYPGIIFPGPAEAARSSSGTRPHTRVHRPRPSVLSRNLQNAARYDVAFLRSPVRS